MISISHDSYIRMTFAELMSTSFENVYNELSAELAEDLIEQGIPAVRAGFSEWRSTTTPAASIGFTFFSTSAAPGVPHATPEKVRTNVMLTERDGYDLGAANAEVLRLWLDTFQWKSAVATVFSTAD